MIDHTRQDGSILLEGLIAILLFSLGILSVVALQAASSKMVTESRNRLEASYIANQLIGIMWANSPQLASFETSCAADSETGQYTEFTSDCFKNRFKIASNSMIVPSLPNGKVSVDVNGQAVKVFISWSEPGSDTTHRYITKAQIED